MDSKMVSVQYNDTTIDFPLPKSFEDFIKLSLEKLSLQDVNIDSLNIYYKDEDNDTVVITSTYDYDQALKFLKTINENTLTFVFEQKSMNNCPSEYCESIRSGMVFDNKPLSQRVEGDQLQDEMDRMTQILKQEEMERDRLRMEREIKKKEERQINEQLIQQRERELQQLEEIEKEKQKQKERELQQLKEIEKAKQRKRELQELEEIEKAKQRERELQELEEIEKASRIRKEKLELMQSKLSKILIREVKKNVFNEFKLNAERKKRLTKLVKSFRNNELTKCMNAFKANLKESKSIEEQNQQSNPDEGQMMSQIGNDDQETRERLERKKRIMEKIQQKAHEEVSKSRIINEPNEYKSALNQIKDDCSIDIAKKMSQYIDAQYQKMKEELIQSTLKLNNNTIQTYIERIGQVENERQSQFQVEMSKVSQSIMVSKTYTGVHQVQCNQCQRNPIVGMRYQCSECHDYNLCEYCEENNYSSKIHPHDFIRIREQRKGVKLRPAQMAKGKYSYECLDKERTFLFKKCASLDNKFNFKLLLKNNYGSTWNEARLVCDKLKSSIVCSDIIVPKLAPEQSAAVFGAFNNIDVCKEGVYMCILKFNVDGIDYGEPLHLTIKIEEIPTNLQNIVTSFRKKYDLLDNQLSDYTILQALGKTGNDYQKAFELIFP